MSLFVSVLACVYIREDILIISNVFLLAGKTQEQVTIETIFSANHIPDSNIVTTKWSKVSIGCSFTSDRTGRTRDRKNNNNNSATKQQVFYFFELLIL